MKLIQSIGIFCLLAVSLLAIGCADDEVTLQSISIASTDTDSSITEDDTLQFTATGNYSDGTTKDLTGSVTWSSSGTDSNGNAIVSIIASGTNAGLATAENDGTATITATITIDNRTISGSTTLTVTSAVSSTGSVSIVAGATSLCTGAYDQDTITVALDATTNTATVTWTNTDTVPHTVISTNDTGTTCTASGGTTTGSPLNSGTIAAGGTFPFIFTATGEYNYVCTQPGHLMRGKVIVQ